MCGLRSQGMAQDSTWLRSRTAGFDIMLPHWHTAIWPADTGRWQDSVVTPDRARSGHPGGWITGLCSGQRLVRSPTNARATAMNATGRPPCTSVALSDVRLGGLAAILWMPDQPRPCRRRIAEPREIEGHRLSFSVA